MSIWWPGPWGEGITSGAIDPEALRARAAKQPDSPHQAAIAPAPKPSTKRTTKTDG